MVYFILVFIIIFCLAVIFYLVGNKVRKLKLIAVEEIPQERQTEVKKRLLEIKLQKKLSSFVRKIFGSVLNFFKSAVSKMKRIFVFFVNFKKVKLFKKEKETGVIKREIKTGILAKDKLAEAEVLMKKRKWDEAEEKYIDILKDDPKNVGVFMALGDIYTARKEWQSAEETYRHIMRIDPSFLPAQKELGDVLESVKSWEDLKKLTQYILKNGHEELWVFLKLGLSYKKTGYPDIAEEYFERAVELEPKNESALDYLIETAIINKNKPLALKAFNTLLGVSADLLKIQSYKDKIDIL
ncbi:tetratricopeptide repeat protein [Candidatus Kuenenbacteria bacterium]|nr:tetratricopeptide repeat protein [Candidatus Kuenenbacteria bacterium]